MTMFSEVNPANTTEIWPNDANSQRYQSGARNLTTNFDGRNPSALFDAPLLDYHIYLEDDQTSHPPGNPEYYNSTPVRTFPGPLGQASSLVVVTTQHDRIDLDTLYEIKLREVGSEDRRVRYNAVDTSLSANWWLLVTESSQAELTIIGIGANQREIRSQAWPVGVNAPWVGIYNAVSESIRRYQITAQATWDTLLLEWNNHAQQTGNATENSRSTLEGLYNVAVTALSDAGGNEDDAAYKAAWDAVAAHDPADPAWGYPATINFNGALVALYGA